MVLYNIAARPPIIARGAAIDPGTVRLQIGHFPPSLDLKTVMMTISVCMGTCGVDKEHTPVKHLKQSIFPSLGLYSIGLYQSNVIPG